MITAPSSPDFPDPKSSRFMSIMVRTLLFSRESAIPFESIIFPETSFKVYPESFSNSADIFSRLTMEKMKEEPLFSFITRMKRSFEGIPVSKPALRCFPLISITAFLESRRSTIFAMTRPPSGIPRSMSRTAALPEIFIMFWELIFTCFAAPGIIQYGKHFHHQKEKVYSMEFMLSTAINIMVRFFHVTYTCRQASTINSSA